MSDNPQAALYAALAAAQAEITDPVRSQSGQVRGKRDYRYVGLGDMLAVVRPVLSRHGLAFTQTVDLLDGQVVLTTRLLHRDGGMIAGHYPLDWSGGPQDKGSVTTYARRYSLEAIVGIAPSDGDDDAASAQRSHETRSTSSTSRPAGAGGAPPQVSPPRGGSVDGLGRTQLLDEARTLASRLGRERWIDLKARHALGAEASVTEAPDVTLRALVTDGRGQPAAGGGA